jgi:hypothetical protein
MMKVNIGAAKWEPVLQAVPYERDDLPSVELTEEEVENLNLAFEAFDHIQQFLWDKVEQWQEQNQTSK